MRLHWTNHSSQLNLHEMNYDKFSTTLNMASKPASLEPQTLMDLEKKNQYLPLEIAKETQYPRLAE